MWRWVVGAVVGGGLLLAASKRGLSYMGVPFVVEQEKTYWKYAFDFGGERYEVLDQPSRDEAIAAAQNMIETLKGVG